MKEKLECCAYNSKVIGTKLKKNKYTKLYAKQHLGRYFILIAEVLLECF